MRLQILFNKDSDLERLTFIKRPTVIPAQFVARHLAFMYDVLENEVVPPHTTGFILLLCEKFLLFNLQSWKAFQSLPCSCDSLVILQEPVNQKSDTVLHFEFLRCMSGPLGLFLFCANAGISEVAYLILVGD